MFVGARSWAVAFGSGAWLAVWVAGTAVSIIGYAIVLFPWFASIAVKYLRSPSVIRGLRFGPESRNYLDLYLPKELLSTRAGPVGKEANERALVPVVVVVMGGAWVIGHRGWNAQVGFRLAEAGVLVVAVDYRNYPFGLIGDMLQDLERAFDWVFANIADYGGDVGNMALLGQSAGAHLEALLLVDRALAEARAEEQGKQGGGSGGDVAAATPQAPKAWSPRDFKGWAGVSGVYDMPSLECHLHAWGSASFLPLLTADGDLLGHSPLQRLRGPEWRKLLPQAVGRLPRAVRLFHGGADTTVQPAQTVDFGEALRSAGVATHVEIREGVTHSEPVVEDPFRGGDLQAQLVVPFLGPEVAERLAELPPPRPQPPRWVVSFAEHLMPF